MAQIVNANLLGKVLARERVGTGEEAGTRREEKREEPGALTFYHLFIMG